MATVTELTYDIDIEFPIVKDYIPIQVIRGDDVTLRFTQPSGENWVSSEYNITIYDESTRATLGSVPFSASTTTLVIDNYNFDTNKALAVLERRRGSETQATATMTVTNTGSGTGQVRITYDGNSVDVTIISSWTTDEAAAAIASAVNNDGTITCSAAVVGSAITFTADTAGTAENSKTVTLTEISTSGFTVDTNPSMTGGTNYQPATYKTIAHFNFVVFEGGNTVLTNLGFVDVTQEDDTVVSVPYFQTGFDIS